MELGLSFSRGNFVFDRDPAPLPKRRRSPGVEPPIFGPCLLWPNACNRCMYQDGTWHGRKPWSSAHCARWGHSSPPPKRGQSPLTQFSAHLYCGQTAGCIKMALGTEVGPGPVHILLDGDTAPLPQKRGQSPPHLLPKNRPMLWWPNGCMDQDAI